MTIIFDNLLFLLIGFLMISSAAMVTLSKNPVHSILFLVLVFIITTCIFIIANVEFISMLFLVVYLGAIIVLFLFIVMMLNVRIIELKERLFSYLPISLLIIFLCFAQIIYIITNDFINPINSIDSINEESKALLNLVLDKNWNIVEPYTLTNPTHLELISSILFTEYVYIFLLAGVVLMVAMIGAIVLTLTKQGKNKKQDYYLQTNKDILKAIKKYK